MVRASIQAAGDSVTKLSDKINCPPSPFWGKTKLMRGAIKDAYDCSRGELLEKT